MRYVSLALGLVVAVVLALPARSEAVPINSVIDFNTAPTGVFTSLVVGDFTLTWIGYGDKQYVGTIGAGNNALIDPNYGYGAAVTMSLTSGQPFTVTQFTIVTLGDPKFTDRVDFGGVSYPSTAMPPSPILRNDLVNVTSVLINIVDGFAVDDIYVTYDAPPPPAPTAVPEPATLSLIGLGALGLAHRLRRRSDRAGS